MLFSASFIAAALALNAHAFTGKVARIMPLGASITNGVGSSHGNGYRDDLYNLLANDGNTVNMVGQQKTGDFHDPDNEGWPGYIISQVIDKCQISMPINRPNIVTILVGTNDMVGNVDVANAPARLGTLIDDVLDWPWLTTVIVSTLPPNANSAANPRIDAYNAAMAGVVQQRVNAGRSVILVDSHATVGLADLVDGTHPNDAAYERMGRVFYDGIVLAESKGWLWDVYGPAP
ncbi:carbohydrate esterase family 3 protein [Cylindrobasidium torrendii FP15055 ss-10]|uniref:Carbohydrate esterase family 3 protein n=1 Tax=Cylindrobasidium torrendii FP15055 ss-10 TaxID=1314674 RepID=A0A0D7BQC5_9AGAR|nr:carbohydrate esterase family 3 protein [Cylindrobasidium torrendii FP15055 ss-10]